MPPRKTAREIIASWAAKPENAPLIARAKAERDADPAARKASRRLPTPPRQQLPGSGRRGKRLAMPGRPAPDPRQRRPNRRDAPERRPKRRSFGGATWTGRQAKAWQRAAKGRRAA